MTIDDLVPARTIQAVAEAGLHKIAGAMLGLPELTLEKAAGVIGARAYRRRKEARAIVDGIAALATLQGEKVADNSALMALLQRAAMPALAGAGIAAVPHLLSQDPSQHNLNAMLPSMGIGALLGGGGSAANALHHLPPGASQDLGAALRGMR